jgi:DedD protein
MHQRLKERLVGAAVLVVLAVIFIPIILTGPIDSGAINNTNIPERPTEKFNSNLIPLNRTVVTDQSDKTNDAEVIDKLSMDIQTDENSISQHEQTVTTANFPVNVPKQTTTSVSTNIVKDKPVGLTAWVVQLGSFSSKENADKLNTTLRKSGFPAFVEPIQQNTKTVYRVRVGPELLRADADTLLKKIKEKNKLNGIVLNYP